MSGIEYIPPCKHVRKRRFIETPSGQGMIFPESSTSYNRDLSDLSGLNVQCVIGCELVGTTTQLDEKHARVDQTKLEHCLALHSRHTSMITPLS